MFRITMVIFCLGVGDTGEVVEFKYAILKADGAVFYETKATRRIFRMETES